MSITALHLAHPAEPDGVERKLQQSGLALVGRARSITIDNNDDYQAAAAFTVEIKRQAKDVKAYWADPKQAADEAHKRIVAKEKAMLTPLDEAERILKATMGVYTRRVEEERLRAEAEMKRKQREEADRLLREAMEAERSGDSDAAEASLTIAQMIEEMPSAPIAAQPVKAAGVSERKVWKCRVIDEAKVPASVNGIVIRPVDQRAIEQIAKMTNGTAIIPGMELYQESVLSIRS